MDVLGLWERGAEARRTRRALALLAAAQPEAAEDELAQLAVGRRDAALLSVREALFGRAFTGLTTCPSCSAEIELEFDVTEVRRPAAAESPAFHLSIDGLEIDARLPNSRDLARLESLPDVATARAALLAACVIRPHVDELPPNAVDAVAARMAELDPQADVALDVTCPDCAHAWREPFDVAAFLWNELSAAARRLLLEVHQLATAYGWSENDILAMSPVRRHAYLEMLA